jgi:proline iminopeptidase
LLHAVEHPERVARLALVSPAPIRRAGRVRFEENFAARMQAPELVAARGELQASGLRERDPDAYRRRAFELSVAGYFRDPEAVRDLTPFRVTGRTQQAVWDSLGEYDLRPRLRQLASRMPHLAPRIVHGTFDPMPIAASRELAELFGAQLIELPVGHCPHVEATDAFVQALDAFLPRA